MQREIKLGPSTVWMKFHGDHPCRLCGHRTTVHVEIFYPANAERDTNTTEYICLCDRCISAIHAFIADSGEEQA